jgi:4-amino-4-deoxy-L-arabinose transferase-like glycosyltransferase
LSIKESLRLPTPANNIQKRHLPWEHIGLAVLLAGTGVCFIWGLDQNGYANPYYSAAALAGSQDWTAFFFGSLDAGNLITIDKPPLSIWIMSLSVRLFGLNSWALLLPQALMGIATTWLVYKIMRRNHGAAPALLGGLIYATTPVVLLMSRFNNPEPLMGLLMVAAVYFTIRAMEQNGWTWYLLAGGALGLGFMAKQIQAFLVIPGLVVAVLLLGAGTLRSRLGRLLAALFTLILTGASWMAVVDLTPASSRPYVGGSVSNSMLELTLDYNGLARFLRFGSQPQTADAAKSPLGDLTYDGGLGRLFNANFANEGAWLLFSALICAVALMVLQRQSGRDRASSRLMIIGVVWLLSAFLVVSFMGTMTHTYYIFSTAAPVAIVVPLGLHLLWNQRQRLVPRVIGALLISGTGYIAFRIFQYSDEWGQWPAVVACLTVFATVGWLLCQKPVSQLLTLSLVTFTLVLAPILTDAITLAKPQAGTNPLSGPVSNNPQALSSHLEAARLGNPPLSRHLGFGVEPSGQVTELLKSSGTKWAAATYTAQNAAQYQLASQRPVVALGGWLGTDPAPTFEQFKALAGDGQIAYFIWQQPILDAVPLGRDALAITEWVQKNFDAKDVDGVKLYDLRS